MNIEFLSKQCIDDPDGDGVIFRAKVDGKIIPCIVSDQALQDYRPSRSSNAKLDTKRLFEDYRAYFEDIAKKKIQAHNFNKEKISITTADIQ